MVIVPNLDRELQVSLFSKALVYLSELNDLPVNKLIEVLEDGSIHVRDWSSAEHELGHIGAPDWLRD